MEENSDLKPSRPTPRTIAEGEDLIRRQTYETAYVWRTDESLLLEKDGEEGKIKFSDEELAVMPDSIFSHNHPAGSTLSPQDIEFAITYNLAEIRVVTRTRRFTLLRPAAGWSEEDWKGAIGDTYKNAYKKAYNRHRSSLLRGTMLPEEFTRAVYHEAINETARRLRLDYREEK